MSRPSGPSPRATILLVEDDVLVRDVAAQILEEAGYTVLQAENAQEAMQLIERERSLDLVFSDVRMPGQMDGVGLAKWIRRFHPQLLVVLASGYVDPKSLLKAADVDAIMQKPYAGTDVVRRLDMLLATRRNSAARRKSRAAASADDAG